MYLDNAATSYPKPESVYDAVLAAMRNVGASPGRGGYRQSLEAGRILLMAREAVAGFFSVEDSSRIIFTHNATGALNLALHGTLVAGDHVITTSMEHNSLLRPLYALQKNGVELSIIDAGCDGVVAVGDVCAAVKENTRMIAVCHVSNVCGAIQPIDQLAELSRDIGALFLVDAAQSSGYIPVNAAKTGIDLLAVPGHKGLMGPSGTGFLYAAPHVRLKPLFQGGTGSHSTAHDQPLVLPEGFEAGTHNLPGIAGLGAGIAFLVEQGFASVCARERVLLSELDRLLRSIPNSNIFGPVDSSRRCSALSFTITGVDPGELAAELDLGFDVAVRAGLHCAPLAHRTLGTFPTGTVRVSPGFFTTREEIAFFSDAVVQCTAKIRRAT